MSTTQAVILRDLVREYALGRAGTATSATTTTVVDAANFGGNIPGGIFPNGSPIRITSGAAAGGNSYKSGLDPSTGTITFGTIAGNTGTPTFVISNVVESVDRIVEAINRGLTRRVTRAVKVPLTYILGGDLLGSTPALDGWTGTTATLSYLDLTVSDMAYQRYLRLLLSAGNGYAEPTAAQCVPGDTWNFVTWMRAGVATDTATLSIRDATNTAVITPTLSLGALTTSSTTFVLVAGTFTIPTGCYAVNPRYAGNTNGNVFGFGPFIAAPQQAVMYPTQSHLASQDDFLTLYGTNLPFPSSSNVAFASQINYLPINDDGMSFNDFGWGSGVNFQSTMPFPLFYDELAFYPALASDADTTNADEEVVLLAAYIELAPEVIASTKEVSTFSRGKVLPGFYGQRLQQAEQRWASPRIQRLLAPHRVGLRRTYRTKISA